MSEADTTYPELKAKAGCCEEASPMSHNFYIPCNKPATCTVMIRDEGPYLMCTSCGDHNVRNRGGRYAGWMKVS